MSWPGVRVAVLEGLKQLVDNPHAQPVMKKALPQLASLLADPSLKVYLRRRDLDLNYPHLDLSELSTSGSI